MKHVNTPNLTLIALLLTQGINPGQAAFVDVPMRTDGSSRSTAGGDSALANNTRFGFGNTGFGDAALQYNTTGSYNTASGFSALHVNTTGDNNTANGGHTLFFNTSGSYNTATGFNALMFNSTGGGNTASGSYALFSNKTGIQNTASGFNALYKNTTGNYNIASGVNALYYNTTGGLNTGSGANALYKNTTGIQNTALGVNALYNKATGDNNLALGANAGGNLTSGSNNIYLRNPAPVSAVESNTTRIGSGATRTFIAGIRGIKTGLANAVPVLIDANGQLGTANSSARFKKDIQDMAVASHKLLQLRPVTYHYKQADESGANPLEYGLIAEEVAKVYPDLVAYDAEGKIETVQYQKLTPMLLNELQRTNHLLQADELKIQRQAQEIASLSKQAQVVANLKQQVTALQTKVNQFEALSARLTRIEAQQMVGLNR